MSRQPGKPKWAKGLSDREALFVVEFLKDLNRKEAYLRLPGVTDNPNSAKELGSQMAMRPHVAKAIEAALHEEGSGARLWLIEKLRTVADGNLADFFDWTEQTDDDGKPVPGGELVPTLRPWREMPRELTACVSEIVRRKDGSVRLKLHDPLRAAEILAKVGAISLTREHIVLDDPAVQQQTPDHELARRIAFLLQKAARSEPKQLGHVHSEPVPVADVE